MSECSDEKHPVFYNSNRIHKIRRFCFENEGDIKGSWAWEQFCVVYDSNSEEVF